MLSLRDRKNKTSNIKTIGRSLLIATCLALAYHYFAGIPPPSIVEKSEFEKKHVPQSPPFPLILAPPVLDGGQQHVDLMEDNDGIFRQEACATWSALSGKSRWQCKIEWDEWMLANALVHEGDIVIEFGARYGTTSCTLSRNVGSIGQVIAVEPDFSVHGYLLRNRHDHRCDFHVVLGTVSMKPQYKAGLSGYAQMFSDKPSGTAFPRIDVPTIESAIGKQINVALIDCEGCIAAVDETGILDDNNGVEMIIMEEDAIDYTEWHKKLVERNFQCIWYTKDTFHPERGWSKRMRHSAWIHKRSTRPYQTCQDYVASKGYNETQIDCIDCPV